MIRRLVAFATLLVCATTSWAQRPLKVYISADMEGITGVASADQLSPAEGSPRHRELLGHGAVVLLGVQRPVLADAVAQQQVENRPLRQLQLAVAVDQRRRPRLVLGLDGGLDLLEQRVAVLGRDLLQLLGLWVDLLQLAAVLNDDRAGVAAWASAAAYRAPPPSVPHGRQAVEGVAQVGGHVRGGSCLDRTSVEPDGAGANWPRGRGRWTP